MSTEAPPRASRKRDVARLYLGGLLSAMALGQALSWGAYTEAVRSYSVGGADVLAVLLFAGEALAGLGLLLPPRIRGMRPLAAWTGLGVASLWSLLAVQAFVRGLVIPNCGCFGAYLSQSLAWWVLLEDAAFVALGVFVVARLIGKSARRSEGLAQSTSAA